MATDYYQKEKVMFPSNNGLPTPIGTLDEVMDGGDSSEKAMKVFIGHNLGNRTFLMSMPMHEFYGMSAVANDPSRDGDTVAQRTLDPAHAQKLAMYLLKGLVSAAIQRREINKKEVPAALSQMMERLGRQAYMAIQPLVVNVRDCNPQGIDVRGERMVDQKSGETASFRVFLSQRHVLWVIDGQHRRKGMQMVFDFFDAVRVSRIYPKKGGLLNGNGEILSADELKVWEECYEVARSYCTLLIEVHLGLEPQEERQLFHDLNRLGKKVDTSLALQFDSSNPVNLFIKERLIDQLGIQVSEADVKNWQDDEGRIPRKDLVSVNAILLLNQGNITSATPAMLENKTEVAHRFWTAVQAIPSFGEDRSRERTVAAQPVVLKALAKLTYNFSFSNRRPSNGTELTDALLSGIADIDFSHENPMWRFYNLTPEQRVENELSGLEGYLPLDDGANRDVGSFQGGHMRFGSKHNDIIPILGDMIRWRLNLPNRRRALQDEEMSKLAA